MLDEKLESLNKKRKLSVNSENLSARKMNKENNQSYNEPIHYIQKPKLSVIPTTMVRIESNGFMHGPFRAMLDTGADPNLIQFRLCKQMRIPLYAGSNKLVGVSGKPFPIQYRAKLTIRPWYESSEYLNEIFWVLPKEAEWRPVLPNKSLDAIPPPIQISTKFADPEYFIPLETCILLGVRVVAAAITSVIARNSDGILFLETMFGVVIFGAMVGEDEINNDGVFSSIEFSENQQLDHLLTRLWKMDQVGGFSMRTKEEELVEKHFMETHTRDEFGRFIVRIPLKDDIARMGNTKDIAFRRFLWLEKWFEKHPSVRPIYIEKMREGLRLGYIKPVSSRLLPNQNVNYIPHFCVTKKKLRIVFDGSCKSDKGISLNDMQMLGEKLQRNLYETIMRFRRHRIAVCADIKKMFNQVKLARDQWDLQRIFWRENRNEPIKEYWLTVVTFGLTSSGYLSVRSLLQVAREAKDKFPEAAAAIENDFYVDDCTTGSDDETTAMLLANQMRNILGDAGFELCQWKSNSTVLMKEMKSDFNDTSFVFPEEEEQSSILGLKWLIKQDKFTFEVKTQKMDGTVTKRKIVSLVAQLYDLNGYISPVLVVGKVLIQHIWTLKIGWDEQVPPEVESRWNSFWEEIILLEKFRIDRWLGTSNDTEIQIHGFSDASSVAYGAVVYIRSQRIDGTVAVRLMTSKTKVAPLKVVTIPRLELSAAELLSRMIAEIRKTMDWPDAEYHLWSDSSVTLHWINKHPCNLKVFVANRVASIQENTDVKRWHYVNTKENPADLVSRGVQPSELINSRLWLHGPDWLEHQPDRWPIRNIMNMEPKAVKDEMKQQTSVFALSIFKSSLCINARGSSKRTPLFDYSNRLEKLLNIVRYIIRFIDNWSDHPTFKIRKKRNARPISPPTLDEKARALSFIVRKSQEEHFKSEIVALKNGRQLPEKSKLEALKPMLDGAGILRVGGRIGRSEVDYEMKHPYIIANGSRIGWLILENAHRLTKHGGTQVMMQYVRQRFWIPKIRSEIRTFLHKCVICSRYNYKLGQQLMSELPADRVQTGKPFLHSGVDYAGPFEITIVVKSADRVRPKDQVVRTKCWVSIFVCLKTRAVHIDTVSNLTATAFIACYERFISRRGRCERMYSDNGTSFVGANNELKKALEKWSDREALDHISQKGTEWHFMIPAAPHQGGIYEAAVKSMKYHLKRIVGQKILPQEDFFTLLVQIEGILNSRPIHPLSDDIRDIQALTPGHFLIGEPIIVPPQLEISDQPASRGVKHWRERQNMRNHFWKRWQAEYLTTLQERKKWRRDKEPLEIGQLVVLKNENFPPAQWALGRICELITSKDGLIRSVVVQTSTTRLTRPVQKLCILPLKTPASDSS